MNKLIYCGPNIEGLSQYTVFDNGLGTMVDELCKKYQGLQELFVPIEKLIETMQNIEITGTAENAFFNEVVSLKGGN